MTGTGLTHLHRQQSWQRQAADSVISHEIVLREIRRTHSDADEFWCTLKHQDVVSDVVTGDSVILPISPVSLKSYHEDVGSKLHRH